MPQSCNKRQRNVREPGQRRREGSPGKRGDWWRTNSDVAAPDTLPVRYKDLSRPTAAGAITGVWLPFFFWEPNGSWGGKLTLVNVLDSL